MARKICHLVLESHLVSPCSKRCAPGEPATRPRDQAPDDLRLLKGSLVVATMDYCVRIEPGRDLTTRVCRLAAQHQATRNPCSELGASLGQLRYLKFLKFYREGFLKAGAGPGGAPGPTAVTILRVSDRNRRIPRGSLSRALAAVPPASQPTVAGRYHDRSHGGRLC